MISKTSHLHFSPFTIKAVYLKLY